MAFTFQQFYFTPITFVILLIWLLLVINTKAEEEHKISEELTTHPNWKLLDRGDNCGLSEAGRIIGGTEAKLGQYPWIVRLGYNDEDFDIPTSYECGGSIISSRYILTAAHCSSDVMRKRLVQVRAGEHYTEVENDCEDDFCADPVQDFYVDDEVCHPEYEGNTFENDICLLRLSGPIKMNKFVSPICMPAYDFMFETSFNGEIVETAGWGIIDTGTEQTSDVLLMLKIPVTDHKICTFAYAAPEFDIALSDKQMCAGGKVGKDSCGGDSGGPLMKICSVNSIPRYFLLGVTSFGQTNCGEAPVPGVYTVVHKYWKWILDSIKE